MYKQSDSKYLHFSWCLLHKPESCKNKLLTGQPLRWKLSFWRFFLDFVVSFLKKSKVLSFKWNQLFLSQCFSISMHPFHPFQHSNFKCASTDDKGYQSFYNFSVRLFFHTVSFLFLERKEPKLRVDENSYRWQIFW